MRTRVIQDEPKPPAALQLVPQADDAGEQASVDAPPDGEQEPKGADETTP
jgi:hypothetical protein